MPEKMYFCILIIFCGILSQGINGTLADEDTRESSNVFLRQKRVVNRIPGEDVSISIQDVPYIVAIRQNGRIKCIGSILSHHVVITVAQCVRFQLREYQIVSGTSRADRGHIHSVTNIRIKHVRSPWGVENGIALVTVNPSFVYGNRTWNIPINSEPLTHGIHGIVSGWGYNFRCNDRGTNIPLYLRSMQVPIIPHRDCVNSYRPHNIAITDADVCTYHELQHCGHTDRGAPLVIQGHLVGIHLFTGPHEDQIDPQYPDVFALLQYSANYHWIMANMREIEAQFQNHDN